MPTADTNFVGVRFAEETTWGTPVTASNYQELRVRSSTLAHTKGTAVSELIRSDRQRDFLAEVEAGAEGQLVTELAFGTELEILLEHCMFNDAVRVTTAADTVAVSDEGGGIKRLTPTAGTPFANFVPGQFVRLHNFDEAATGDGTYEVSTVNGGGATLDVIDPSGLLTVSANDGDERVDGNTIVNGTTFKSLTIEQHYSDIGEFMGFPGMRIGEFGLAVAPGDIVVATLGLTGKQGLPASVALGTGVDPASDTQVLNATSNMGTILEGGAVFATPLRSINFNLSNNLRRKPQIGNKFPIDIGAGFTDVTGTMEAYFEDLVQLNKFVNHTSSAISFRFQDLAGNIIVFTKPRLFFSDGSPQVPGGNEDVILNLEYTAIRDDDPLKAAGNRITMRADLLARTADLP